MNQKVSKWKQVVVEESSEKGSSDESSSSSFERITSDESETEEEDQDTDYEEGEVDVGDNNDTAVEEAPADEGHILPTSEAIPAGVSPIAEEEEGELLDYGEYGHSPCKIVLLSLFTFVLSFLPSYLTHFISGNQATNTEVDSASPSNFPPVALRASPRFSIPPLLVIRKIAFLTEPADFPTPITVASSTEREIAFPVEPPVLLTSTTVVSSTEAMAPFAEMVAPKSPFVRETLPLAIQTSAESISFLFSVHIPLYCLHIKMLL